MKTNYFILLLCLPLLVQSQDFAPLGAERGWDLFIPGRTSYYMQPSGDNYLVETFMVDSTRADGGKEFMYFNAGKPAVLKR